LDANELQKKIFSDMAWHFVETFSVVVVLANVRYFPRMRARFKIRAYSDAMEPKREA
jgi:hypothetical protein